MYEDIKKEIHTMDDVFNSGYIVSMKRYMPSGEWDDTAYYHIKFSDGTERDFYYAEDLLDFMIMLNDYLNRKAGK